jgi:hypothetical protein
VLRPLRWDEGLWHKGSIMPSSNQQLAKPTGDPRVEVQSDIRFHLE